MKAYVLIDCRPGDAARISGEIKNQPGVIMADPVDGPHPVVAVVESDELSNLAGTILFRIRKTEGVRDITVYLTESTSPDNKPSQPRQRTRI